MKKICLVIVLFSFTITASADLLNKFVTDIPIQGAFGIKLGDSTEKYNIPKGDDYFTISPPNPITIKNENGDRIIFGRYYIRLTENKKYIYEIGVSFFESDQGDKRKIRQVIEAILDKYKITLNNPDFIDLYNYQITDKNNSGRYIFIYRELTNKLYIKYTDTTLQEENMVNIEINSNNL